MKAIALGQYEGAKYHPFTQIDRELQTIFEPAMDVECTDDYAVLQKISWRDMICSYRTQSFRMRRCPKIKYKRLYPMCTTAGAVSYPQRHLTAAEHGAGKVNRRAIYGTSGIYVAARSISIGEPSDRGELNRFYDR